MRTLFTLLACISLLAAQSEFVKSVEFETSPALQLSSDNIELTMLPKGGNFVSIVLRDDATKINPFWNPAYNARAAGKRPRGAGGGHFLCVDGFGNPSPEEKAAGLPGHGEAHTRPWKMTASGKVGNVLSASFRVDLPLTQEEFRRTIRLVDGESVVYVESELKSLLAFDRPVFWAEHATIGAPFLESGKTVVDMSAKQAKTRTHLDEKGPYPPRLKDFTEFTWPDAPGVDGGTVDVRFPSDPPNSLDHTTSLMDPTRKLVWVTALHLDKQLLLGYVFKREEYPWLQCWDNYGPKGDMARGLEFSTLPFDVPRREAVDESPLFGTPAFRWLPAKSTIESRFLFFYTKTPAGFARIEDVVLENGQLTIKDVSGKTVRLKASQGL